MTYYGAKQLADAFRTVRKNTIVLAEEIPAGKYDFTPAAEVRTVRAQFAHIAMATGWQVRFHREGGKSIDFERFSAVLARNTAEEQSLATKDQIIEALRTGGEEFASFLESLDEARLAETISFPAQLGSKSRFEMLTGIKEHEMHHRAQLMLVQRLLGIVPHLTRQRQEMRAAAAAKV